MVLIPGIERTIARKHVLLLNFPREAEHVGSFTDLARLKQRRPAGWWWRPTRTSRPRAACGGCWTTMPISSTPWK